MKSLFFIVLLAGAAVSLQLCEARTIYEPYTFTTLAGYNGHGSNDGAGRDAQFYQPTSVALDRSGNLFVTDSGNYTIRKVTPAGVVTTFAGVAGEPGGADGQGNSARFLNSQDITVGRDGNIYVADGYNYTVRKITPDAIVTTIAGSAGLAGYVDGIGADARFGYLDGVTVDRAGNVFVSDPWNHALRKITSDEVVTMFANSGFLDLEGLGIDQDDNIYIADYVQLQIYQVTPTGAVTQFRNLPIYTHCRDVTMDRSGNAFVTDGFGVIVELPADSSEGVVIAGGYAGSEDGKGLKAQFLSPAGITVDNAGTLYLADSSNDNIRKINRQTVVTTFAGRANIGSSDGVGEDARFYNPNGVAADAGGTAYVTDSFNHTIRKMAPDGVVTTIAGKVAVPGSKDGPARQARFNYPAGIAVDTSENIYIADSVNFTIRKITADGLVITLAGLAGAPGSADGYGSDARFFFPSAVAVDQAGSIYVADTSNQTIRKISATGQVTTLAGLAGHRGSTDGVGAEARFNEPAGVAADTNGNLYVGDESNNKIRKITSDGTVTTFAGSGEEGSRDGSGIHASFYGPRGVAFDTAGNLYVSDFGSNLVRKITPAAKVTTLAGAPREGGWVDGTGSDVRFSGPIGISVDGYGNVLVADTYNEAIRRGFAAALGK